MLPNGTSSLPVPDASAHLRKAGESRVGGKRHANYGAMTRLRPVLMTTLVAAVGILPMALNTGIGAEVQRPLATVVVGGVISAMIMSLLVLRVLYSVFAGVTGERLNETPMVTSPSPSNRKLPTRTRDSIASTVE